MKALLVAFLALLSTICLSIDIRGTYVEAGGDIYGVTAQAAPEITGGGNLRAIFDHAAQSWNSRIGDPWQIDIKYGWSNSIPGAVAQYYGWWMPFGDLRHFQARILINPDYQFFADPTPGESSEYASYQESSKDYGGGAINTGRVYTGTAYGGYDLLTILTHEIGHSLSIGVGPRWSNEVADGNVDLLSPLPFAGSLIPVDGGHLADPSALMWYGVQPGERRLVSDIDLMAGMQLSGFTKPVPEPVSLIVLGVGLAALIRRRKA